MTQFSGFTQETSAFLRGLGENNTKAWFDAHRDDYETHYLAPAKSLVEALGDRLLKLAPGIRAEPRVNGSIFRINRDIRFSRDKTPYKDHIDLWFWEGPNRKTAVSAFFLRIRATRVEIGAGALHFERQSLAAYRKSLSLDRSAKALATAISKVERAGFRVYGEHYKKLPRGVKPSSELRDTLMRHNALWCSRDQKLPDEFYSAAFATYCSKTWRKLLPLHRWLVDELQS